MGANGEHVKSISELEEALKELKNLKRHM
jgi:hypothetical protein